jgi:putative membrane protein
MMAIEVMEMLKKASWLVAAVAICAANAASAADKTPGLTAGERIFAEDMADGGLMEVKLGALAEQKAGNQAVKDFAARMVKDHTAAGDELKALATAKGIELPKDLSKHSKAMLNKLSAKSGAAFDKDYMQHMLVDHRKDLALLRIKHSDPDLQAWQNKVLPVVEEHFKLAQETSKKVVNPKVSSKSK